jgi:hypothetical protein
VGRLRCRLGSCDAPEDNLERGAGAAPEKSRVRVAVPVARSRGRRCGGPWCQARLLGEGGEDARLRERLDAGAVVGDGEREIVLLALRAGQVAHRKGDVALPLRRRLDRGAQHVAQRVGQQERVDLDARRVLEHLVYGDIALLREFAGRAERGAGARRGIDLAHLGALRVGEPAVALDDIGDAARLPLDRIHPAVGAALRARKLALAEDHRQRRDNHLADLRRDEPDGGERLLLVAAARESVQLLAQFRALRLRLREAAEHDDDRAGGSEKHEHVEEQQG